MHRAKTADDYYANAPHWRKEITRLRDILLADGFDETIKWGQPTYMANGRNVVGLGCFKSYFGLWFFEGAALTDDTKVLINAQPGKTRNLRQWRMTSADEIEPAAISRYLQEAKGNAVRAQGPGPSSELTGSSQRARRLVCPRHPAGTPE